MTKPYLSVCGIYLNEAPYLREWVEFHRLVGVEHFYLYNNRSTDNHREVLAPYIDEGLVELTDWDVFPGQMEAYDDCLERHRDESDWIAFIDLDEFLFSPTGRSLPDMLTEYERWPGVGVNWALFGPSGHTARPDGLVIENYVRRSDKKGHNDKIKSIVDPRRVRNFCLAHFFVFHGEPHVAVDENHRLIDARPGSPYSTTDEISFERFRVNHYTTKSEEEFRQKQQRIRVDNGQPREWTENQIRRLLTALDEVEDRTIQMYLPALRAELARVGGQPAARA
jgi:hypothetical protein